jgi:exopolyphosphatase/guanosine-5'-triphosphate,3'-diphosphate pyrophosphatase
MDAVRGAVLDLGSNSVKFLLAEQRGRTLYVHAEQAFTTRLGEGVETTRRLTRRAIRDTLDVLLQAKAAAQDFGATRFTIVATSALRSAANADAFCTPARALLGRPVRVISGATEARWAYSGICSSPAWASKRILAMDLGGGSIEFILGRAGTIEKCTSLPLGCVRLHDLFFRDQPAPQEALDAARALILSKVRRILPWFQDGPVIPVGSGGTMFTLTALHLDPNRRADPQTCEGLRVPATAVRRIAQNLACMDLDEIRALPAVPPSRAAVITPGALIYDTILQAAHLRSLGCATLGLRYGAWQETIAPVRFTRIRRES